MPLRLVIENISKDELAPMPSRPENQFIEAALLSAKNSQAEIRDSILKDVCGILNCDSKELGFLFDKPETTEPNGRSSELNLPDYRMCLSDIYKEAAE